MKTKDIIIGGEYLTRVSKVLVKVRVTGSHDRAVWGARKRMKEFTVVRCDNGRQLEPRTCFSLRQA